MKRMVATVVLSLVASAFAAEKVHEHSCAHEHDHAHEHAHGAGVEVSASAAQAMGLRTVRPEKRVRRGRCSGDLSWRQMRG